MEPKETQVCGQALTDMEVKARELGKARSLRAYLVVLKQATMDPKCPFVVSTLCFTAPSWSHVAAMYDRPENGVEILKQEFLAPGEVSVYPLLYKGKLMELADDLDGLKMCYACKNDFREQPAGRCSMGHRTDKDKSTTPCRGYAPKVG